MVNNNLIALYIDDGNGPVRNPVLTDDEFQAGLNNQQSQNIELLWQTAHDYEYAQISGSAIGMVTLGVLQNKPKSMAVQMWIQSIWKLYYSRKSLITSKYDDTLYDFSSCGTIPHTVPELMEELGM